MLPLYGRGDNIRDWLYVEDNVRALVRVLEAGEPGRTYNISAREERTNLEVVETVCAILDELAPRPAGRYAELIRFVPDRPGHDTRYALDDRRLREELGWRPSVSLEAGLERTVRWYLDQRDWVRLCTQGGAADE